MAIRFSLRHLFWLLIAAMLRIVKLFKVQNILIELPITLFLLLVGVYHIRYSAKIVSRATWYDNILGDGLSERGAKWSGYLLVFLSIVFSMIMFFR